ncbi:hypothetical protein PoB_001518400 [Plakobranchus ocellatus]|uniref:Uncharacterized protein n=1 Tax=Plakobranchus ocellatus TaxID=259542 RepID=A0AAV3Z048_9GAST|nr:hypothetical protein PoB_001518400 [Plakobranchus ocellatus]
MTASVGATVIHIVEWRWYLAHCKYFQGSVKDEQTGVFQDYLRGTGISNKPIGCSGAYAVLWPIIIEGAFISEYTLESVAGVLWSDHEACRLECLVTTNLYHYLTY